MTVDGAECGRIERGLVTLLGVSRDDGPAAAASLAEKVVHLRVFEDDAGKMNRSLIDVGGAMLVVSQFTLLGDCRQGRRPSFTAAAPPDLAETLYEAFMREVRQRGVQVAAGRFRSHMQVALVNDGPVTLIVESGERGES